MANSLGYDVVDSVTTALNDAGYNDQTTQEVMIQSKDSAVLVKLKQQQTKYKLVYTLPQDIGSASATSLVAVKEFADAVVVERNSVFALSRHFIIRQNDIVEQLQSVGLRTYVQVFSNDFVSPPWDFFSDGTAEINSYVQLINIDGFVTDSPKTVRRYKKNSCTGLGKDMPSYMKPVVVGSLAQLLKGSLSQPPTLAPMPELNASSVEQPPLFPVMPNIPSKKGFATPIGVGIGVGILLLILGALLVRRKLIVWKARKSREFFFKQNRGLLLQRLVDKDIAEKMMFRLEEIQKATNNFEEARKLGGGGHGTVYKGVLSDQSVVAIKKSKFVIQREIDDFINEVAILSQVNHRNVVKLFGCCLETEVPLLVYEFISNGTLSDHLHVSTPLSLPWKERLRIALETSRSLAYLHSAASVSIVHRDIKSTNILLDDRLTAKVSDFGASRGIPIDQSGVTTAIQGTLGYLDPEYYHTWRLSDKSDVYSFGVVLVELLTRKKPCVPMSSPGASLIVEFISLVKQDKIQEMLDWQVIDEGGEEAKEVAVVAVMCLSLKGEDRPTMRKVETRLEAIQTVVNNLTQELSNVNVDDDNYSMRCGMGEEGMTSMTLPR